MAVLVNGERIEADAVREEAERMRPQFEQAFADEEPEAREARLQHWAKENVIERTLLTQEALRDPEPVPAKDIDDAYEQVREQVDPSEVSAAEVRERIELRLRIERLIGQACKELPKPADEAVEAYYAEHTKDFMLPEQVRAAHIVKHVDAQNDPATAQAELLKVHEQIEAGADFAELATAHSDCPENGGELGYFARGQMVEEFEHLVFSMAVGQVSHVFPSRFGFHIVKLLDRKAPEPAPLEQVREHIGERLVAEARNAAMEKFLDTLRSKATIEEKEGEGD